MAPLRETRLDDIDVAIVRELQLDGRLPYAQLGPKVGLSQAAVRQRVQRMLDSGVIEIVAVTNPKSLGYQIEAMIGIQIEGDLRAVAARVAMLPSVDSVVITSGRFDVLIEVACTDTDELLSLMNDVIRRMPGVKGAETFTYLHRQKEGTNR